MRYPSISSYLSLCHSTYIRDRLPRRPWPFTYLRHVSLSSMLFDGIQTARRHDVPVDALPAALLCSSHRRRAGRASSFILSLYALYFFMLIAVLYNSLPSHTDSTYSLVGGLQETRLNATVFLSTIPGLDVRIACGESHEHGNLVSRARRRGFMRWWLAWCDGSASVDARGRRGAASEGQEYGRV